MASFVSPPEPPVEPQPTSSNPLPTEQHPGAMREKRPRIAKTKLSKDPSVYIDDCPDSPKRQKTRPRERSCRVPVALHPNSSSLANSFFPAGFVYEQHAIKSVATPTIATLRSMNMDLTENVTLQRTAPQFLEAQSCHQLVTTEFDGKCEEFKRSTTAESMDHGHIVPIAMVPPLASTNKGLEQQVALTLDAPTNPETSIDENASISPPVQSRATSPAVQQQDFVNEHSGSDVNKRGKENPDMNEGTPTKGGTTAEKNKACAFATSPPWKERVPEQDDGKYADLDLSLPAITLEDVKLYPETGDDACYNIADTATETEILSRGKDGMVCSGGIRHVPPMSVKMVVPVVEVSHIQSGAPAEKPGGELHMTCAGNLSAPSESEETRTASLVSQLDYETDEIASRKSLAHSPKAGVDLQVKETQAQEVPDPMTEKLINLDISLNMAWKRFDHRSLLVTLDYLLHLPLKFTMLQGCALGQTVNNLRKHDHPDVAKLATILVRLWRWVGGQYFKEICGEEAQRALMQHGGKAARGQKKGNRSVKRAPKSAKDLTSIVQRLESVIRDL